VSAATPIASAQASEQNAAAVAMLREMCKPLKGGATLEPLCVVVQPNEIPHPADSLLVHHEHMTEVLRRHYGAPVTLHVLDEHLGANVYTRKVGLTPVGEADRVVEWGVARLNLQFMSDEARREILAKHSPLGEILIRHQVLRRIKPRWFMRFPARGPMLGFFGEQSDAPLYGRIGTIYCNEAPAIELLEIVTA
jgi:hypothetical protein